MFHRAVKAPYTVKDPDPTDKARTMLIDLLRQVPVLDIRDKSGSDAEYGEALHGRDDLTIHAKVKGGKTWLFHGRVEGRGYPKEVRNAVLQIKATASEGGGNHYHILAAPYFSEESAFVCREGGVGYLDFSGNCHISFGNIYIHVEGKPNHFKDKRPLRSIFSPKASRLLRVLLQGPLVPWKVTELAETADVSTGLVSKLRTRLLDLEWAEESREGLKIIRPEAVLDAWSRKDRWEDRTTVREYSLLAIDPHEIARRIHEHLAKPRHAFTQWFAAHLLHPHTAPPVVSVYVSRFPDESRLQSSLGARGVDSGGRLRLVVPDDEGVFLSGRQIDGLPLVSDVQIYLDTLRAGQRGEEAAKELRNWPGRFGLRSVVTMMSWFLSAGLPSAILQSPSRLDCRARLRWMWIWESRLVPTAGSTELFPQTWVALGFDRTKNSRTVLQDK